MEQQYGDAVGEWARLA
ncbi:uncharacterized protein CPUR_08822 [Claviceps purpurea 20.1]|uniref:Uncharacterized protein n=1 Tax=Claviceps purpurea (strain 20.1) TaxID=1111077 RepID=M1WGV7_CLAP2|nr:uncharacterized protein CPUR_08822 [Claviceps purpurea 20.1]